MSNSDPNSEISPAERHANRIALDILHLETLETRNADRLDFHDLAVWSLKEALIAAFNAGRDSERQITSSTD